MPTPPEKLRLIYDVRAVAKTESKCGTFFAAANILEGLFKRPDVALAFDCPTACRYEFNLFLAAHPKMRDVEIYGDTSALFLKLKLAERRLHGAHQRFKRFFAKRLLKNTQPHTASTFPESQNSIKQHHPGNAAATILHCARCAGRS